MVKKKANLFIEQQTSNGHEKRDGLLVSIVHFNVQISQS